MTIYRLLVARLAKSFLQVTLLALLVCLLIDGVERAEIMGQGGVADWAALILWRQPGLWRELLPVLVAVGVATGLAGMRRRRELTALAAAGVSPWQVTSVAVAAAIFYSGSALGLVELVQPRALERVAEIELKARGESAQGSGGWWLLPGAALRLGTAGERSFENLLWVESEQGRLSARVEVSRGTWQDGAWKLENATRLVFGEGQLPTRQSVGALALPGPEVMALLGQPGRPAEATLGMLQGLPVTVRGPWWHQRLAGAFLPGLLALLLSVFGLRYALGRTSAVTVAVLVSTGTWLCMSTMSRLSTSPLAAWGPLLALAFAVILLVSPQRGGRSSPWV